MSVILTDGENEIELELLSESEETVNIFLGWLPPTVTFMRKEQGRYEVKPRKRKKHAAPKPRLGSVPLDVAEKKAAAKRKKDTENGEEGKKPELTPVT